MTNMETTMELDELKSTWQMLDRHLQQQSTLNLHLFREGKLDKARSGLRRLYWGKIVQILFGDALIYFGIMAAIGHRADPPLLACSLFMLAYGVLTVVFGGVSLGRIASIDYTAPVLEIQKRVDTLRRTHVLANWCLGLPWWFLWIAIFTLEMKANVGVDLFVAAPGFIGISGAIGVVGFVAAVWYFRRRNARLDDTANDHDTPRGLRDAKSALDDISRFERP
jgi:serine/threonine-protein kinase